MNPLLNQDLQSKRAQLEELVKDLHDLTINIGHTDLAQTVSELRNRLHEPFMFVIVGEVKAGKSSFINALLATGKEVTKVAPQPMTDTIQQIIYGEKEETITLNPYLKKILLPVDILRDIAIVDTPGTNTIVEHHQEITESFIPASDLIVFVFEAKNPYRQSAWEFFNFIHSDWRKKIIFVLQQKDLMSAEDLAVNVQGVADQAEKKGISDPTVFAVSAKQDQEGQTDESGFGPLRAYIKEHITGGQAPVLKLLNSVSTCQNINERLAEGIQLRKRQLEADRLFRQDIRDTLDDQETKSKKQVEVLVENLLAGYDRITYQKEKELRDGLSFFSLLRRTFTSIFSKKQSAKEWLEGFAKEMEGDLHRELNKKLNEGVVDVADNVQQMAKIIDLKIRNSETILKNDHEIFSDIAERRSNVLRELQETFSTFINRTENFTDEALFPDKQTLSPNIATGSGMAAIGAILMAVANTPMFDITGGILTGIGLLFAGFSTNIKKRKIIEGFTSEIQKGRTQIEDEVDANLKTYIENLKIKIDDTFGKFDQLIEKETKNLGVLEEQFQDIDQRLESMANSLQSN